MKAVTIESSLDHIVLGINIFSVQYSEDIEDEEGVREDGVILTLGFLFFNINFLF